MMRVRWHWLVVSPRMHALRLEVAGAACHAGDRCGYGQPAARAAIRMREQLVALSD
jgi:hypothetical protein